MVKRKPSRQPERGPRPGKSKHPPAAKHTEHDEGHAPANAGRLTGIVLAAVGILGLLHLISSFIPGIRTWGIDYWSEFPVVARLGLAVLLGVMLFPGVAAAVDRGFSSVMRTRWARLGGMAALAVLFIVFRSRGFSYGDGYSFLSYFPDGMIPVLDAHLSTQALDLIIHWATYRFILMPLGGSVALCYAIWAAIGGLLGLWAIGRIAAVLTRDRGARRLIVAMAMTSGVMVLWFGHVESYTLVTATSLWMIAFALESQRKHGRIWAAWGMWLVAMALHQLALAFLPALAWVHWRSRRTSRSPFNNSTIAALFGAGFLAWAIATFLQRQVGMPIFVPIYALPDTLYSAFSVHHLLDAINLILFLAPLGLLGLAVWPMKDRQEKMSRIVVGFIGVMAAWAWYFAFWVDPLIGAFRDWDLLAVFGLPLSIWAGVTVANRFPKGVPPRWLWVPVAALGLVHSGTFVATIQDEMAAAFRIDRLVREDVHYTAGFFDGTRLPPWAAIIGRSLDRYDLARDHLGLRVKIDPTDALAWANLGNAYRKIAMPDSALWCYRQASDHDSTNLKYANNLGVLYTEAQDYSGAEYAFKRVVDQSDSAYAARTSLGMVYLNLGKIAEARAVLDEAVALRPDQFSAYYNRGLMEELLADTAAALADYEKAVQAAPGLGDVYSRIVQLYQWSGRPATAIEAARRWQSEDPKSATAIFLEGTCYYMINDNNNARKTFERVLLINSEHALSNYYLASTYRRLGNLDLAEPYARNSANLDPTLGLPHLELVYIAADRGDHAAAVAATREYLKRSPADSSMAYLQQFMER